ncbi:hypothetical protein KVT40_007088 [Elsinoe batatas]|uniref:Uncharacterized protein n=1 Tax=Elsinoe batatas TaxID=2601811 RepID=A0A8K0PE91_9PEZI|nr:hypothetical protein KVT40_007088 [Elsinoe batatas]
MSRTERIVPEWTGYMQEEEDAALLAQLSSLSTSNPSSPPSGDPHGRRPTPQGHEWWKSPPPTETKKKTEALAQVQAAWGEAWLDDVLPDDLRPKVPTGQGVTQRKLASKEVASLEYEDGGKPMGNPYQFSGKLLVALAKVAGMTQGEGAMVREMLREVMEKRNATGGAGRVEIVLEVLPDDVWEVFGKITGSKQG